MAEGIEVRHKKACPGARPDGRCCKPTYRAWVWSERDGKVRRTFPTMAAAKLWREDAKPAMRRGEIRRPAKLTLGDAALQWMEAAERGEVRNRSGRPYKPSTLRGYRRAIEQQIIPELGRYKLPELRPSDLQEFVDTLCATVSPSTARNTLDPLRAIYRRAIRRDEVAVNPTRDLELPASDDGRDRIATPAEATALLEALPAEDRAIWATALYAGLRRGELRALRVCDVDLGKSEISVERGWDEVEGPITTKSRAGRRVIPLLAALRDYLDEHLLSSGRTGEQLLFGRTAFDAFVPSTVRSRALRAWEAANTAEIERAESEERKPKLLDPIGLHECRHTFASLLIDCGENAKAVQEFMGHASITMTFDLYGHLMPGSRDEARKRMDAYLESAVDTATVKTQTPDPVGEPQQHSLRRL